MLRVPAVAIILAVVALGLVIATVSLMQNQSMDSRLYNVLVEGERHVVRAYDRSGSSLWQVQLDSNVVKAEISDLDQNGTHEVVVATGDTGTQPGRLLIYDSSGNLLVEHNLWKHSIYSGGAKPEARIVDFEIADINRDNTLEIVTISDDVYWYVGRLAVMRFDHNQVTEVGEYWHPGLLYTLTLHDFNHDGVTEILVTGVNNDLQAIVPIRNNVYVAFLLEGTSVAGQAPPGFGSGARGSELWYGYLTPTTTSIVLTDIEDTNNDGIDEIQLAFSDSCSVYLTFKGVIVGRGRGSTCAEESHFNLLESAS